MPEPTAPTPQAPVETPRDPDRQHGGAKMVGAVAAPAMLLLANNLPGVEHRTDQVTSTEATVVVETDQVPVTLPAPEDTVITLTPDVNNEYRVDFQATEGDAGSSESQVTGQLEEVLSDGDWARVYDIQVEGNSSADDEQPGGGLQTESEANTNLAMQRALIAAKPVIESFAEKGIDVHQKVEKTEDQPAEEMIQVRGVEDSWSDGDLATAQSLAEQFGYDSVEQMVEMRNDGKGMPPAVDEFLQPLLEGQRGAKITLRLRGEDGGERRVLVTVEDKKIEVHEVTRDVPTTEVVNNNVNGHVQQVERASAPRPWEQDSKDALYRKRSGAPRGNGAKPLRFGGGVPFNPTPSNFSK